MWCLEPIWQFWHVHILIHHIRHAHTKSFAPCAAPLKFYAPLVRVLAGEFYSLFYGTDAFSHESVYERSIDSCCHCFLIVFFLFPFSSIAHLEHQTLWLNVQTIIWKIVLAVFALRRSLCALYDDDDDSWCYWPMEHVGTATKRLRANDYHVSVTSSENIMHDVQIHTL